MIIIYLFRELFGTVFVFICTRPGGAAV